MSPSLIWLFAGAVLIGLEVLVAPGIGLFFAGLAAITTGALVEFGIAETTIAQVGWMCAFTVAWAAILWKPAQKFRKGLGKAHKYDNIVGSTAVVCNAPLKKGVEGQVKWSGSVMSAKLVEDAFSEEVPIDSVVEITEVSGNTLTVKPK